MDYKKKNKKIFFTSIAVFIGAVALGFVFMSFDNFGLYWEDAEAIVQTPGLFSLAVFMVSGILHFCSEVAFLSWWKFAKTYLSVALAIILYFVFSGGGGGGVGSILDDAESMTMFLSAIFFIVSIAIIIVKSRKLRGG